MCQCNEPPDDDGRLWRTLTPVIRRAIAAVRRERLRLRLFLSLQSITITIIVSWLPLTLTDADGRWRPSAGLSPPSEGNGCGISPSFLSLPVWLFLLVSVATGNLSQLQSFSASSHHRVLAPLLILNLTYCDW
jgi:hypothetical protein